MVTAFFVLIRPCFVAIAALAGSRFAPGFFLLVKGRYISSSCQNRNLFLPYDFNRFRTLDLCDTGAELYQLRLP